MKRLVPSLLAVLGTAVLVFGPRSPRAADAQPLAAAPAHAHVSPGALAGAKKTLATGWRELMSSGAVTCGTWRWAVKTLSDKNAGGVTYAPVTQSVGFLRSLKKPSSLTASTPRIKGSAEFKTYRLGKVRLLRAVQESDRDIHLVVAPPNALKKTMIVEFPNTNCKGAGGAKKAAIASARQHLLHDCGSIGSSFVKLKGTATLTGVGFFDEVHGQSGVAPNGIELHPVLSYSKGTCSKDTGGSGGGGGGGGGGDCTPGYSPCLVDHNGADYDCYGGGGNGPYYTKPGVVYTVSGSDPYGLDSDNDGKGCE